MLFHPVGLRTQDETEKLIIWNSGSCISSSWSGASLIVQPGALKQCDRFSTFKSVSTSVCNILNEKNNYLPGLDPEFRPLIPEKLHLECNIKVLFVSPDILRACQKTPHRHRVAQRLLQGTGKVRLCWRPGLHREKSIHHNLSTIFS